MTELADLREAALEYARRRLEREVNECPNSFEQINEPFVSEFGEGVHATFSVDDISRELLPLSDELEDELLSESTEETMKTVVGDHQGTSGPSSSAAIIKKSMPQKEKGTNAKPVTRLVTETVANPKAGSVVTKAERKEVTKASAIEAHPPVPLEPVITVITPSVAPLPRPTPPPSVVPPSNFVYTSSSSGQVPPAPQGQIQADVVAEPTTVANTTSRATEIPESFGHLETVISSIRTYYLKKMDTLWIEGEKLCELVVENANMEIEIKNLRASHVGCSNATAPPVGFFALAPSLSPITRPKPAFAPRAASAPHVQPITMSYDLNQEEASRNCGARMTAGKMFRGVRCYNRGAKGRYSYSCTRGEGNQHCYKCGKFGHRAFECVPHLSRRGHYDENYDRLTRNRYQVYNDESGASDNGRVYMAAD